MDASSVEKVEIEIMHNKYTISCKAGESDSFRKAARTVNSDIRDMQNLTSNRLSPEQVLALVAVNYCKDGISRENEMNDQLNQIKSRIKTLCGNLDKVGSDFS
ncbi:MAG: cell division protein ZapA [Succinivibrionaceae bacterium]